MLVGRVVVWQVLEAYEAQPEPKGAKQVPQGMGLSVPPPTARLPRGSAVVSRICNQ